MSDIINDKRIVLESVKRDGYSLEFASEELQNDKEIVFEAVKQNGTSLKFASKEMRNDEEVVLEAVKQNGASLEFARGKLQNDKVVVLEVVKQNGDNIRFASGEMRNDHEVVLEAVKQNVFSFQYASKELKNDKEFVLETVKIDSFALSYASDELKNDKEFILDAVREDGYSLSYADEELKNDKEFILDSVKQSGFSLKFTSEEFHNDKEVILEAVKQNGASLKFASERIKNDREFVLCSIKQFGSSLKYASEELRNDKEFVLESIKQKGYFLEFASEELKNDREVVLEAVKQNGRSLNYASGELKNDKEVVLEAVKQFGSSLSYASEELKNDKDIVLEAVKQNGYFLDLFASEDLKNDKEVVLEAVKHNGDYLRFATVKLRNNIEFVIECCLIDRRSIIHIGKVLENDSSLVKKMKMYGSDVERAFEEFERERLVELSQNLRIDEEEELHKNEDNIWIDLCYKLFKTKWKSLHRDLVNEGMILEERLKEQRLRLNDDLEDLKKKLLGNETALFRRIQKWHEEVNFLNLDRMRGIYNKRLRNYYSGSSKIIQSVDYDSIQNKLFKDLQIFRALGRGGYGSTYLCKIDGCFGLFVVKLYQETFIGTLSSERERRFLKRDHLQIPPHENVVPILSHSESEQIDLFKLPDFEEYWKKLILKTREEYVYHGGMLIMKYHQTTLYSVINNRLIYNLKDGYDSSGFLPSEVILIMKGVLSGAFHLHQNKIVHRDLHPGNIFIHLEMGRVWVGDFGCCLDLRNNPVGFQVHKDEEILYSFSGGFLSLNKTGGAPSHCPPEILDFDPSVSDFLDYSKSDLYSCGMIGKELFNLVDARRMSENFRYFWKESSVYIQFIESILVDFEKRISFEEAFKRIGEFEFEDVDV